MLEHGAHVGGAEALAHDAARCAPEVLDHGAHADGSEALKLDKNCTVLGQRHPQTSQERLWGNTVQLRCSRPLSFFQDTSMNILCVLKAWEDGGYLFSKKLSRHTPAGR